MRTTKDIAWLAGMVEGEGCIAWTGRSPHLAIASTDRDVIDRCAELMKRRVEVLAPRPAPRKQQYATRAYGPIAASWLMTLYPMLGERRQAKAREVLGQWRARHRKHKQTFWIENGGRPRALAA